MKLRSGNIKALDQSLSEMGSISRTLFLPPEIWSMVGDEIHGVKTLQSLVLVCHAFRDVFKPHLHSYRLLELSHHKAADLRKERPRPTVAHAKSFQVYLSEWRCNGLSYTINMNNDYRAAMIKILDQMPNLRSFQWLDSSFEYGLGPSFMVQHENVIEALKRRPKLKHLSIQLSSHYVDDVADLDDYWTTAKCWISLKGFCNLTSLELYNIWAHEVQLKRMSMDIAQVLASNPNLRKLGLAMACEMDSYIYPEAMITHDAKFLETLSECYSECRAKPLALDTLRLGHQTLSYSYGVLCTTEYLKDLVQMKSLKTLNLFNGHVKEEFEDDFEAPMELDWKGMKDCKSLHQLSVSRLGSDVRHWLNHEGHTVEELIVADHYSMYDDNLNNFGVLKLPNLSMLFTREITTRRRVADHGGSDVDERWDDVEYEGVSSPGPSVKMDRALITVLDRLKDGGRNLTRLALSFDFATQWARFSENLKKLPLLSQLRINSRSHKGGKYPDPNTSIWPDVREPKDIACHYAKLIKSICPSLQYIQIGRWTWQINVPQTLELKGDIYQQIELREMEFSEVLHMELFALDNFPPQAGLPGPEEPDKEIPETEYSRMEELSEIMAEALSRGENPHEALRAAGIFRG